MAVKALQWRKAREHWWAPAWVTFWARISASRPECRPHRRHLCSEPLQTKPWESSWVKADSHLKHSCRGSSIDLWSLLGHQELARVLSSSTWLKNPIQISFNSVCHTRQGRRARAKSMALITISSRMKPSSRWLQRISSLSTVRCTPTCTGLQSRRSSKFKTIGRYRCSTLTFKVLSNSTLHSPIQTL